MEKALHDQDEAFLSEKNGEIVPRYFTIDDILAAVNNWLKNNREERSAEATTYRELYEWMNRYIEEGATEEFLNDLNANLYPMQYKRYVVPPDFFAGGEEPQALYVANFNIPYTPKTIAANDFSKLMTRVKLKRLKQCQLSDCDNFFLGPPQAKWCSKTCGSNFRVSKKRKRDIS